MALADRRGTELMKPGFLTTVADRRSTELMKPAFRTTHVRVCAVGREVVQPASDCCTVLVYCETLW